MNSHYIPQFILKGFCNERNNLIYCDFDNKTTSVRNTRSVFAESDYYPDELEKDLCHKIEYAFANLYHSKLKNADKTIDLTKDELFVIHKYLIVSALRYKYELTENDKRLLEMLPEEKQKLYRIDSIDSLNRILEYKDHDELLDYLNRTLKKRSIFNNDAVIDEESCNAQLFMETREVLTNYIIFVRPHEEEEFLIPDVGRCSYFGKMSVDKIQFAFGMMINSLMNQLHDPLSMELPNRLSPRDFMLYPLSKDLAIISMSIFYGLVSEIAKQGGINNLYEYSKALGFSNNVILNVPPAEKDGIFHHSIRRINSHDVCHLNCLSINQSKHFVACSDLSKIQQSLRFAESKITRDVSFMKV